MSAFEGYADPGFQKELARLGPQDRALVLTTLRELANDPGQHPNVKAIEGSGWPGTIRVRCGPFRVLALVLPTPRVLLFTTLFRKKRPADYADAIHRHDARVEAQGSPLDAHVAERPPPIGVATNAKHPFGQSPPMRPVAPLLVLGLLAASALLPLASADHPGSVLGLAGLRARLGVGPEENLVHRLPDIERKFAAWESQWPDLVERSTLGETSSGHPLLAIRVTDETVDGNASGLSTDEKLIVYLDGGHHGNEYLGVELVMYYLEDLLTKASEGDADATAFLRQTEVWALPILNVDGNLLDTRKNSRLVDPNRNYPFQWGGEGSGDLVVQPNYRGPAAMSENEVKVNAEFGLKLRPDLWITMHTGVAEFYWPWGWTMDKAPDMVFFESLEKPFEEATNGRVDAMQSAELYVAAGATDDYGYAVVGVPTFTYEVHEDQNVPVYGQPIDQVVSDQLGGLHFMVSNVRHLGAWLEAVEEDGQWSLVNEGWGVATNVTLRPRGGGEPVPLGADIPRDGRAPLPAGPEAYEGWEYPVLLINTTKVRHHTFSDVTPAAVADDAKVPAPGVALLAVAVVAAVLALRRR